METAVNNGNEVTPENEATTGSLDVFQIDINNIPSVAQSDQSAELQSLNLSVYDQETLERGILEQVDRALEQEKQTRIKSQLEKDLENVADDILSCQRELEKNEALIKSLDKMGVAGQKQGISIRKGIESRKRQLQTLKVRQQVLTKKKEKLSATTAHENEVIECDADVIVDEEDNDQTSGNLQQLEETEMERKIRLGEMTPFGSMLDGRKSNGAKDHVLMDFERYLQTQAELEKKLKKEGKIKSKNKRNLKNDEDDDVICIGEKKKRSPLEKSIRPKKRKKKEKLGTFSSEEYSDQTRSPGQLLSETTPMDDDDDDDEGSEYQPSDGEWQELAKEEGRSGGRKKNVQPRPKKQRIVKRHASPENWGTDDSDWDYSDEESRAKRRKSTKKEIDDGNIEDYLERLKYWEETKTEEETTGDHELEGGYKLPKRLWNKLFNYQKVGVQWMWELNQQRCGGILGDEMGLGKTIQIIAFLAGLSYTQRMSRSSSFRGLGPVLIVCPTTVMHQWVREFHTWWPPFRVAVLHESGSFNGKRNALVHQIGSKGGILVTSYVGVVKNHDALIAKDWHYIVLDEGHKIRNPDAQVTLAVKQYRTPHRIILSGSPMQNNLKELWSLFDFIFPGKLGTLPVFLAQLAIPITEGGYANASQVQVATAYRCAMVLRDTIAPYLLRRVKSDVQSHVNLPPKNEQVLFCGLTEEQRRFYKAYLDSGEVERILAGTTRIFLGLMNLRKICNHPDLFSGGPKLFRGDKEEDIPEEERFGHWKKSGKMIVVESLLKIWKKQGHRVLLFTQGCQMLAIMEAFVQKQNYKYLKLDGATSISARQPLITKFNQDTSYFVFLLTTRVGGLGVNLTGADRVVIYDPDWNPATDTQARERAWRIGQKNRVTIYRLVTAGTIEEKIYHRQIFKQFLTNKVLSDPKQRRFFKSNDLFELFTLKESDQHGSTETGAIFAGTGSEVKLGRGHGKSSPKSEKEKNKSMKSTSVPQTSEPKKVSQKKHEDKLVKFSSSKIEHMKKLAQMLSQKISAGVVPKNENSDPETSHFDNDGRINIKVEGSNSEQQAAGETNSQCNGSEENVEPVSDITVVHEERPLVTDSFMDFKQGNTSNTASSSKKSNNISELLPSNESLEDKDVEVLMVKKKVTHHDNKESDHDSKRKKHKHKKKRRKVCLFEGEEVPHLVRQDTAAPQPKSDVEEEEKEAVNAEQDDYVLRKLFKKSGLKTALKHDKIMHGGEADYALVEGEAKKVAQEAVMALKESRRQCWQADAGVPTWTGQSGALRPPGNISLRFGKKKTNKITTPEKPKDENDEDGPGIFKRKLKLPGDSEMPVEPMSSSELLARIRKRNRLLPDPHAEPVEPEPQLEPQPGTSSSAVVPQPHSIVPEDNMELLTDIRNFVAYGASADGRASTQEILARFKDRLPLGSSPLFKCLLEELCDFHRTSSGEGIWRLRAEFRW
ncbi:DNA excision repair protein ERCC-6 [Anabrus simplex]|uniref:DNA excision repair protein ERCC-6 n=1 Tax=Anabrus simplex TaxID=316456 RepID=UPI0035A37383